jgi:hypothetical protein
MPKTVEKLYRIVNDKFGTYRVEARAAGEKGVWVVVKDHTDFTTYASARQAVRNLAIHDDHERNFEPGQWVFTEEQAVNDHVPAPPRIGL